MPTKKQHFVPRVYLKAWETLVENSAEPNKKFQGLYVFSNGSLVGEGKTKDSILWQPHLYTIKFNQLYMAKNCPGVYNYYVNAIYDIMINNQPYPVYGKLGYSIIKTKNSVRKHLTDIDKWDFYYENGDVAKKKAILNRINEVRCYLLEDAFGEKFENRWEHIRDDFIYEVQNGLPISLGQSERLISKKSAKDMLEFFFMMLCRSPNFNAMGIYTWMNELLQTTFGHTKEVDEMMDAIWFSELYRIFYKETGGFFHSVLSKAFENCQFILFEAYKGTEMFLTSDNPAFQNNCRITVENKNGYFFPLTPKYMLFIAKGKDGIHIVDHRFANEKTVCLFNQIISNNCHSTAIGVKKELSKML